MGFVLFITCFDGVFNSPLSLVLTDRAVCRDCIPSQGSQQYGIDGQGFGLGHSRLISNRTFHIAVVRISRSGLAGFLTCRSGFERCRYFIVLCPLGLPPVDLHFSAPQNESWAETQRVLCLSRSALASSLMEAYQGSNSKLLARKLSLWIGFDTKTLDVSGAVGTIGLRADDRPTTL